nr:Fic family protein [Evansella tamaricis]
MQQQVLELVNAKVNITPALIKDILQIGRIKYKKDKEDDLLRHNLLGVNSQKELETAEAFAFALRANALEQGEFSLNYFTLKEFQDLHFYLFQDIYPFAGKFRDVQLMKGNTRFCQVQYLESYAKNLFNELNAEQSWNSLEVAAERLAYFKSELNMLHPFREGNGRTIRIYMYAFAWERGIEWAYETTDRDKYMQAAIQSVVNIEALRSLFLESIRFIE